MNEEDDGRKENGDACLTTPSDSGGPQSAASASFELHKHDMLCVDSPFSSVRDLAVRGTLVGVSQEEEEREKAHENKNVSCVSAHSSSRSAGALRLSLLSSHSHFSLLLRHTNKARPARSMQPLRRHAPFLAAASSVEGARRRRKSSTGAPRLAIIMLLLVPGI